MNWALSSELWALDFELSGKLLLMGKVNRPRSSRKVREVCNQLSQSQVYLEMFFLYTGVGRLHETIASKAPMWRKMKIRPSCFSKTQYKNRIWEYNQRKMEPKHNTKKTIRKFLSIVPPACCVLLFRFRRPWKFFPSSFVTAREFFLSGCVCMYMRWWPQPCVPWFTEG